MTAPEKIEIRQLKQLLRDNAKAQEDFRNEVRAQIQVINTKLDNLPATYIPQKWAVFAWKVFAWITGTALVVWGIIAYGRHNP